MKAASYFNNVRFQSWEDKELRARLSKINGRFLGTLRQKIRKYNKDFAAEIKEYRENPWESGPEAEADDVPEPESDDEGITGGFTTSEMMDLKKDKKTQDEEVRTMCCFHCSGLFYMGAKSSVYIVNIFGAEILNLIHGFFSFSLTCLIL